MSDNNQKGTTMLSRCFIAIALSCFVSNQSWGQMRLQNDNNYDVWVAVASHSSGVISLSGGDNAPDTYASAGWYKIAANQSRYFEKSSTHFFAYAESTDGDQIVVRPTKNGATYMKFHCDLNSNFSASQTLRDRSKVKQPVQSFFNYTAMDYLGADDGVRKLRIPSRNLPDAKRVVSIIAFRNPTQLAIKYQFRWNPNDKWSDNKTLGAESRSMYSTGRADIKPQIKFDSSTESGYQEKIFTVETKAIRYPASHTEDPNPNDAKTYRFHYSNYQILLFDD